MSRTAGLPPFFVLLLALALAWTVNAPGLKGPFLFDDFPNLAALGSHGGVRDRETLGLYLSTGLASTLGRPVAKLSFLLDAQDWPADSLPFKRSNLLLHLLCSLLLFWLVWLLEPLVLPVARQRGWAALLTAAIWLLHPIQQATIFLVVQRMAQLAALFCFLGMILWLKGRNRLLAGRPVSGYLAMTLAASFCTVLATLSKENGILLPALLWLLSATLAPIPAGTRHWRLWKWLFLILPSLLCLAAINYYQFSHLDAFRIRSYGPLERVLTQPYILLDYLRELLLPGLTATLYYDNYRAFDLAAPAAKYLLAAAAVIALIAAALRWRRRWPLAAFGVLFFFLAHSLEAGPVNLELYFLHRNYLPYAGLLLAAVLLAFTVAGRARRILMVGLTVYALACAGLARLAAPYWGDEARLLEAWVQEQPQSVRALTTAAGYWYQVRNVQRAAELLDRAVAFAPTSPAVMFSRYIVSCVTHREQRSDWEQILQALPTMPYDTAARDAFGTLEFLIERRRCQEITAADAIAAIDAILRNPAYQQPELRRDLMWYQGVLAMQTGDLEAALRYLDRGYALAPNVEIPLYQVHLLQSAGRHTEAIRYLEIARQTPLVPGWQRRLLDEKPRQQRIDQAIQALRAQAEEHSNETPHDQR